MEGISISTIILALIGLLIHTGLILGALQKKFKSEFSLQFYIKDNKYLIITSLLQVGVLLFFASFFANKILDCHVHNESSYYDIYAFGCGFMTDAFWHRAMKTYKQKKQS